MINTVPLHFTDLGGGLPVVLLHGFPFNHTLWRDQQRAMAGLFRVIAPDLRGHGKSMSPAGVYEMSLMATDVFELLDSLKVEKAIFIGHSMGGYVALAAYALQPERVMALGLVGSQSVPDSEEVRLNRLALIERVLQAGDKGASVVADQMLPRLFAPGTTPEPEVVEELTRMMRATNPTAIVGVLRGMAVRKDTTPLLADIPIPLLLLTGDQDLIVPPARSEEMATQAPGSTHIVIEAAGHMPMLEQPYATTEALKQFLGTIER